MPRIDGTGASRLQIEYLDAEDGRWWVGQTRNGESLTEKTAYKEARDTLQASPEYDAARVVHVVEVRTVLKTLRGGVWE